MIIDAWNWEGKYAALFKEREMQNEIITALRADLAALRADYAVLIAAREAVARAEERAACAADVCPRCAAGDERETNGSGWFHRQPDKFAGHLYSACPAAPIHARGKGE